MDRLIRDRWCAKLRDPKTKQTTEVLINENGQCCLGVLSEVMGVKINDDHLRQYDYTQWHDGYYDDESNFIESQRAREEAELEEEQLPPIKFAESVGLTYTDMVNLAHRNDGGKLPHHSFSQIADYIEENY